MKLDGTVAHVTPTLLLGVLFLEELMLDVKRIRNEFDALSEKLATRGVVAETLNELKELDVKRRELLIKSEELKAQRNIASDDIAQAKRNKEDASEQIAAMQKVSAEIKEIDAELAAIDEKLNTIIVTLPNTPNDSVPVGADEDENVEVRRWGTPRDFDFEVKAHWDLGKILVFLTGNVVQKLQVLVSFSTKVSEQDWNVQSTTSCWMSMLKKVTLK